MLKPRLLLLWYHNMSCPHSLAQPCTQLDSITMVEEATVDDAHLHHVQTTLQRVAKLYPFANYNNPNIIVIGGRQHHQRHRQEVQTIKHDIASTSISSDEGCSSSEIVEKIPNNDDIEIPKIKEEDHCLKEVVDIDEEKTTIPKEEIRNDNNEDDVLDEEVLIPVSLDISNSNEIEDDEPPTTKEIKSLDEIIIQKLSVRSYHLPGNNWCQDWRDYIRNNHLVFGLFCHDKLHPVKNKHRILLLFGSLAFGLIVTNIVYLWGDELRETDDTLQNWGRQIYNETDIFDTDITIAGQSLQLDASQMGILWTVGSATHSMFDFSLWHMISCGHCNHHRCDTVSGWSVAISIVMVVFSITMAMIYFRAFRSNNDEDDEDILDIQQLDVETLFPTEEEPDFRFLYGYLIEVFFALFVYSILVQTILFSGILGCGRLIGLGGRPRELRQEQKTKVEV